MEVFHYLTPPRTGFELDLFPDQVAGNPDKKVGMALTIVDLMNRGIDHFSQSLYCRSCIPSCSSPEHVNPLLLDLRLGNIRQDQIVETVEGFAGKRVRFFTVSSHPDDIRKLSGNSRLRRSGIQILSVLTPRFLRDLELRHEESDELMEQVDRAIRTPVDLGCHGVLVPPKYVRTARDVLPEAHVATILHHTKTDVAGANHVIYPRGYSIRKDQG